MVFQEPKVEFQELPTSDIVTASMSLSFCQQKGVDDMDLASWCAGWGRDNPELVTMTEEQFDNLFG